MRRTFPCGHRGLGRHCHRCAQTHAEWDARSQDREERVALAVALGVEAADFPCRILRKAFALCQHIARDGLPALRQAGGKKIQSCSGVLSVPVGRHYRLLFQVEYGQPVYLGLLTHEQYDRRLVLLD